MIDQPELTAKLVGGPNDGLLVGSVVASNIDVPGMTGIARYIARGVPYPSATDWPYDFESVRSDR